MRWKPARIDAIMIHNWLLHVSDIKGTDTSRRAFSVCYMDARTQASNGEQYTVVFKKEAGVDETFVG